MYHLYHLFLINCWSNMFRHRSIHVSSLKKKELGNQNKSWNKSTWNNKNYKCDVKGFFSLAHYEFSVKSINDRLKLQFWEDLIKKKLCLLCKKASEQRRINEKRVKSKIFPAQCGHSGNYFASKILREIKFVSFRGSKFWFRKKSNWFHAKSEWKKNVKFSQGPLKIRVWMLAFSFQP